MRRRLLLATAIIVAACRPAPATMTDAQRTAIADSVKAANAAFWAVLPGLNADSVMSKFSRDVIFADVGAVYPSFDSVAALARRSIAGVRHVEPHPGEARVQVLAPNVAVLTMAFEEIVTDTAGATMTVKGAWSAVYLRQDSGWMMIQAHESLPLPAAPAPARRRS